MGNEIDLVKYLIEVAPVVGVLGWWIYTLKKENTRLQEYIMENEKENNKLIDNLTRVVDKIVEQMKVLPGEVLTGVQAEIKILLLEIRQILNKEDVRK